MNLKIRVLYGLRRARGSWPYGCERSRTTSSAAAKAPHASARQVLHEASPETDCAASSCLSSWCLRVYLTAVQSYARVHRFYPRNCLYSYGSIITFRVDNSWNLVVPTSMRVGMLLISNSMAILSTPISLSYCARHMAFLR